MKVELLIEADVDKVQESGIELSKAGHDPVVHICWMIMGESIRCNPFDGLPQHHSLGVMPLMNRKTLCRDQSVIM